MLVERIKYQSDLYSIMNKRTLKVANCSKCNKEILTINIFKNMICWECDAKRITENAKYRPTIESEGMYIE